MAQFQDCFWFLYKLTIVVAAHTQMNRNIPVPCRHCDRIVAAGSFRAWNTLRFFLFLSCALHLNIRSGIRGLLGAARARLIKAAKGVFEHAHAVAYIVITEVERERSRLLHILTFLSFDVLRCEKARVLVLLQRRPDLLSWKTSALEGDSQKFHINRASS